MAGRGCLAAAHVEEERSAGVRSAAAGSAESWAGGSEAAGSEAAGAELEEPAVAGRGPEI